MKEIELRSLVEKYDIPVPRYTSFPALPNWRVDQFTTEQWESQVREGYSADKSEGISLYIHLPYCESLCTYCGCNTRITVNHAVEQPYIDTLLKEWQLYLDLFGETPLIREIHLGGGTPTFFSAKNLTSLLKAILDKAEIHTDPVFSFEGHPGNTGFDHLEALYQLGFRRVSFGIQDFDLKVQKAINRIQTYEQVKQVTDWAREIGYTSVNYDLIYGLPFQTEKSIKQTVDYVAKLLPDRIAFYSYAHVPWFKPGQRAYSEADLPQGEAKRRLNALGRKELLALGYGDIGMDHFALPTDSLYLAMQFGKLHRNFMGYTEQNVKFMVGLGASSISDSGLGYAQNVKAVEAYIDLVNDGKLPVFRGHSMTIEEQETKALILDIICNRWITQGQVNELPENRRAMFDIMLSEGLIEREWSDYRVSETGSQFLRNICAVFDPFFEHTKRASNFSRSV